MARQPKAAAAQQSGRTVYDVTPKQFVSAWQSSDSADEVSEKLGMPKPIVLARASNYRSVGVALKRFQRKRKSLDVQELNQLIAEAGGREGPPDEPQRSRQARQKIDLPDGEVASIVEEVVRSLGRQKQ